MPVTMDSMKHLGLALLFLLVAVPATAGDMASDIDWSLCDPELKEHFDGIAPTCLITDKDRDGLSVAAWSADDRSEHFVHARLANA